MELNRLIRSVAWAIGLMILIMLPTVALMVTLGYQIGSSINQLWEQGAYLTTYLSFYVVMMFVVLGYMWCYRQRTEYIFVPVVPIVASVAANELVLPTSLALLLALFYLAVVVYWARSEREKSPPECLG